MLIPQSLEQAVITLNLRVTDINTDETISVATPSISFMLKNTGVEWLPGRAIDYRFLFRGDFIYIHTTLTTWTTYGKTSIITVGL
jgi:hypothetical protein